MSVLGRGWSIYATICVCVQLINTEPISVYVVYPRIYDLRPVGTRHGYKEMTNGPIQYMGQKLIPIKESKRNSNIRMPIEPEAEMLPAHYEGVKPPGVDHMELRYEESQILNAVPRLQSLRAPELAVNAVQSSNDHGTEVETDTRGYSKEVQREEGEQGDELTVKKKTEYDEDGGNKRFYDNRDRAKGSHSDDAKQEAEDYHRARAKDYVDRLSSGFRNVYHKDERKKNHDFYDNDDSGGHMKQHGRYNEKHIAREGRYKKGQSHGLVVEEVDNRKQGVRKDSKDNGEGKEHDATHGYDGFVKNLRGYAEQKQGS